MYTALLLKFFGEPNNTAGDDGLADEAAPVVTRRIKGRMGLGGVNRVNSRVPVVNE